MLEGTLVSLSVCMNVHIMCTLMVWISRWNVCSVCVCVYSVADTTVILQAIY